MIENEFHLPEKFTMDAHGRFYNVQWMPDEDCYHIWKDIQSYQDALAHDDYGSWRAKDVLQIIQNGKWKIVSIQVDYANEEDISVDSLEEIL